MKKSRIENYTNGWFIGNFKPTLLDSTQFEVAVQKHHCGFVGEIHYHTRSTEYNLVLNGRVRINRQEMVAGDIFVFAPMELSQSEFLEDTTILVVRTPSEPHDKVLLNSDYADIATNVLGELKATGSLVGAELGVKEGRLSEAFLARNPLLTMYSVDYWGSDEKIPEQHDHASNYEETVNRLLLFGERSIIRRKLTSVAVKDFPDEFFDFVYIDATHTYAGALEDIQQWVKKIKPDGIIAGHDYCEGWSGVIEAVNQSVIDPSKLKLFPCNVWVTEARNIKQL